MRHNTKWIFGCLVGYFLLLQTSQTQSQPASIDARTKHQKISPIQGEARLVSLSIIVNKAEIAVGERVFLKVTGKYSDATEREITVGIMWESSDRTVARINSNGELEGLRPGMVEIRASYSGLTSAAYNFIVATEDQAKMQEMREQARRLEQARKLPEAHLTAEAARRAEAEAQAERQRLAREKEPPPAAVIMPDKKEYTHVSPPMALAPEPRGAKASKEEGTAKSVDDILKEMDWGNIAFNTPSKMSLRDTATIQLVLSLAHEVDELSRMITAKGEKDNARIKVSDRMEADLTGFDFEIIRITPQEQAISHVDATSWSWRVRPKNTGLHPLHLTLTAKFDLNGTQTQKSIRTFERTITVEVTTTEMMTDFVADNWHWLWAPFAFPVGAWVWKKRRRNPELQLLGGIFISYRREDSAGYVQAIYAQLARHIPKDRIFMDVDAIKPGVDFPRVLQRAIAECDLMIAVIGKRWVGIEGQTGRRIDDPKDFVRLEVSTALARGIPVIPVLVEGAAMPPESALPDELKKLNDRQWIELSNTRFAYDLGRLLDAVRDIAKPEASTSGEPSVTA